MNETPSVFRVSAPLARKHHECCEPGCRRTRHIQPGQRYRRSWGVWDGDSRAYVHCLRCARLWDRACALPGVDTDEGPPFTGLLDWWQEALRK